MAKASRETRNEKKKQNTEPDKRIHKRMQRTECRKLINRKRGRERTFPKYWQLKPVHQKPHCAVLSTPQLFACYFTTDMLTC